MLQSMRDNLKGSVAFILVGLLIVPLALFGVDQFFTGGSSTGAIASVNDRDISDIDLQRAIYRQRQQLLSQYGDQLPADFISDERLRAPVLEGLIQQTALIQAAIEGGMTISNTGLDKVIVELPQFQQDGTFDRDLFIQGVRRLGYTPTTYRTALREDLISNQLRSSLIGSGFTTERELTTAVGLSRQTRNFTWVTLPLGDLQESVVLSDDEVNTYYEDNKATFLTEEQVAIEYIELQASDIAATITVTEEQLRTQYEQQMAAFNANTEREAAHILIENGDNAQQKLAELQEKLAAGVAFDELVKTYSDDPASKDNNGYLGFTTGDVFPVEFEDALALLEEGQVSAPVDTDAGTHIIKLVSIQQQEPPTFEQERVSIEQTLKLAQAQEIFVEQLEALKDLAYNAESLDTVGEQLDLPVKRSELFSRTTGAAVVADARLVSAAFSDQVLIEGHTSQIIELTNDRVAVVNKIDHKPVRTLSLDEKRDDIVTTLKLEKAKAQLVEQADSLKQAIDEGGDIAALAKQQSLQSSIQKDSLRSNASLDSALLQYVFSMAKPEAERSTVGGVHLTNGDYAVIELSQVSNGDYTKLADAERTSLRANLSSALSNDEFLTWQNRLRADADIEIFNVSANEGDTGY